MNGIDTHWAYGDVIEVVTIAREALDVIIVPKVRRARDVWWVDTLLTQLEETLGLRKRIALEVLIEETEGLQHVDEIATASDRLEAIIFGAGDFSASQGARVDTNFDPLVDFPGDIWHYARARIVVAARTAGVDAIDAPFPNYQDPEAYRVACDRAAAMGFLGQVGDPPEPGGDRQHRVLPDPRRDRARRAAGGTYRAAEAGRGPAASTGCWSTPPTCGTPPTPCTKRASADDDRHPFPTSNGRGLGAARSRCSRRPTRATGCISSNATRPSSRARCEPRQKWRP